MSQEAYIVDVEFKRVQTFLFRVPRLRHMVGANVLIGEAIRVNLAELARTAGAIPVANIVAEPSSVLPLCEKSGLRDPLLETDALREEDRDDPVSLRKQGILGREGGHFSALFPDRPKAEAFERRARDFLRDCLEGLIVETRINKVLGDSLTIVRGERDAPSAVTRSPMDLPVFQVCQESGRGPAQLVAARGEQRVCISRSVRRLEEAAERFKNRDTRDIIGLLQNRLPLEQNLPAWEGSEDRQGGEAIRKRHRLRQGGRAWTDFRALCNDGQDYLAVIAADGNDMGKRSNKWVAKKSGQSETAPKGLVAELWRESFFHWARVSTRRAVVDALDNTFGNYYKEWLEHKTRPYQLLMLGGDDLLLVCRARYALDFAVNYAREVEKHCLEEGDRLTVGIGVAIGSHHFPFYQLHQLAESLASSAKTLGRSFPDDDKHSVIDWMVTTYSWSDDPIEMRTRDQVITYKVRDNTETLVLSGRPYRVLADPSPTEGYYDLNSLEGLLCAARDIDGGPEKKEASVARSQLRHLVDQLYRGRLWSELSYAETPAQGGQMLRDVLGDKLWKEVQETAAGKEKVYLTPLADLVELSEIKNLGVKGKSEGQEDDR